MVAALDLGVALGVGAPALADRARALLARLGLPVDYERRLDAQAQAGITVDKKRRGSTIRFVFCPAPGETRFVDISPADIASTPVRPGAGRKLDPRIPQRVQAAGTMSGPFRENITQLVERLDGGVAAVLMGFDGITRRLVRDGAATTTRCPTSRRWRWSSPT